MLLEELDANDVIRANGLTGPGSYSISRHEPVETKKRLFENYKEEAKKQELSVFEARHELIIQDVDDKTKVFTLGLKIRALQ